MGSMNSLDWAGKLFVAVALVEAVTWAALLLGMGLKYGLAVEAHGVGILGWLHGLAFMAYLLTCFIAGSRLRWSLWQLLTAVLAAIPPLVTWPLERWYRRRGWLSQSGAVHS